MPTQSPCHASAHASPPKLECTILYPDEEKGNANGLGPSLFLQLLGWGRRARGTGEAKDGYRLFVLDMTDTPSVNSLSVGKIVSSLALMRMRMGKLALAGMKKGIREWLNVTRLHTVIDSYDTVQSALVDLLDIPVNQLPIVEFDHNLNAAIQRLRVALGDSADNPRFIETLPRRGYRLHRVGGEPGSITSPRPYRWSHYARSDPAE